MPWAARPQRIIGDSHKTVLHNKYNFRRTGVSKHLLLAICQTRLALPSPFSLEQNTVIIWPIVGA